MAGVRQSVNSDSLLLQRRGRLRDRQATVVQQVLHTVDAETLALGAVKEHIAVSALWLAQPGF